MSAYSPALHGLIDTHRTRRYADLATPHRVVGFSSSESIGAQPRSSGFFVRAVQSRLRYGGLDGEAFWPAGSYCRSANPVQPATRGLAASGGGFQPINRSIIMQTHAQNPSAVSVFQFQPYTIRVVMIDDTPWFVASDVAEALEYRNAPDMVRILDADEAATHNLRIRSESGVVQARQVTIINESGLYSAILRSRKPEAKKFKKWVTSEVLPAIRRTGSYTLTGGNGSTLTGGDCSTLTGGDRSELRIRYWDSKADRYRTVIAYVGEDGIEAGQPYKLDDNHKFVKVTT